MSQDDLTPAELAELTQIMRSLGDPEHVLEPPPTHIWQSIEDVLASESEAPTPAATDAVRPNRMAKYLLAAAVLVVAAIGLASILNSDDEEVVVATAEISNEGMPLELPASGSAKLVSVGGMLRLDLDVEQLETDTGYFELWVARPDASEVESLGPISGDGSFDWPEGFDPNDFSAVAISLEEDDGDPSFSGVAVLFGVLDL